MGNANSPELPESLIWETAPMTKHLDFAGDIELQLDATITAFDTSWIVVLQDVPAEGESVTITAGWLRAALSRVNEEKSKPGSPVLDCREPIAIPVGKRIVYRISISANARRIAVNHRLRVIIGSSDEKDKRLAMLGFTHTVVREASINTIYSASRLLLPILSEA
jgi:predicted acyl esterase